MSVTKWRGSFLSNPFITWSHQGKSGRYRERIWVTFFFSLQAYFVYCLPGCLTIKLCLTLCDAMDYSLPGSSVQGISQAKILEWAAISFSIHSFLYTEKIFKWISGQHSPRLAWLFIEERVEMGNGGWNLDMWWGEGLGLGLPLTQALEMRQLGSLRKEVTDFTLVSPCTLTGAAWRVYHRCSVLQVVRERERWGSWVSPIAIPVN